MSAPVHYDIEKMRVEHAKGLAREEQKHLASDPDEASRQATRLLTMLHIAGFELTLMTLQAIQDGMAEEVAEAVLGTAAGALRANLAHTFVGQRFKTASSNSFDRTRAGLAGADVPGTSLTFTPITGGTA